MDFTTEVRFAGRRPGPLQKLKAAFQGVVNFFTRRNAGKPVAAAGPALDTGSHLTLAEEQLFIARQQETLQRQLERFNTLAERLQA